jgi:hypothetical protein
VCRSICTVPTATLTRPHLTSEAKGANYPDSGARRRPSGPSCFTAEPGAGRTPKARLTLPDSALKPSTNRAARRLACRGEPEHSRPWRRRTRRWPSTTGPRRIVSLSTRRCGDERSHGPWPGQLGDRVDDESRQIGHPPEIGPQESPEAFAKAVLDMAQPRSGELSSPTATGFASASPLAPAIQSGGRSKEA